MTTSKNEQINLWRGEFGNDYAARNAPSDDRIRNQTRFWARLLNILAVRGESPRSILEVGANVGINLRALKNLTEANLYAVEPNDQARNILVADGIVPANQVFAATGDAIPMSDGEVDLTFTAGVLIHINPDALADVCAEIFRVSRQTIICAEYFNAYPETVPYRGHDDKLFKRDFGSYWLERHPSLKVVDYGFAWKPVTGLDNITWWIFSKTGA